MQAQVLKRIIEVPDSTPYYGILMETGWWTMKAKIEYKKLMLYHNIQNSHEERIIKQILNIQKAEGREGTWYSEVKKSINMYKIEIDVKEVSKSVWKKTIKKQITNHLEEEIRNKCKNIIKTRTVADDKFEMKRYLRETSVNDAKGIVAMRLHVSKLKCNYQSRSVAICPLCGKENNITTEHYFGDCRVTKHLAELWKTNKEDLGSSKLEELKRAKYFMAKVELLMEPKMK